MSLALLFHYVLLNMFRMLIHPSSGVCDLFVELFHALYCPGSMCIGVTLWFGWGGVVSGCSSDVNISILRSLRLICWVISWVVLLWFDVCCWSTSAWTCIRTPHHPSHTTRLHQHTSNQGNTTHEITQQISRKLLKMDVLTSELHPDTTPPQPNHNITPTHIVPEQYNPWNNATNKSQAPEDGCINIRTASGYHTTPAKPQHNTDKHRTRTIQPMK